MGIASLILGIISIIMSLIPGLGIIFSITALIGIILGIISLCKKHDKGKSIAGIITSVIAIIITILYVVGIVTIFDNSDKNLIEKAEAIKQQQEQQQKEYRVGETYNDRNLAIKFVSVNDNFKGYNRYATVKSGYKIIKADFEFENVGTTNQYISSYDFDCYADDYDCDAFWSVENSSFSTTLSSGKKAKGTVYFQVPQDSQSIVLEYEGIEFIVK